LGIIFQAQLAVIMEQKSPFGEAKSINKEKTQNGFLTKTTFASHLI